MHKLLNNTWTCETDECTRFCKDNITKHCKACCNTTCRRVRKKTKIWDSGCAELSKRCCSFCHLDQRIQSLLHTRTSRCRNNQNRYTPLKAIRDCPGDFFTHSRTHAATNKMEVHNGE